MFICIKYHRNPPPHRLASRRHLSSICLQLRQQSLNNFPGAPKRIFLTWWEKRRKLSWQSAVSEILKNTLPTDRRGKTEESQVEKWERR